MPFDENIVCPVSGEPLEQVADLLVSPSKQSYDISDGIPLLYVDENRTSTIEPPANAAAVPAHVTHAVRDFYEAAPFPNYNAFDSLEAFVQRANTGVFARLLREQLPLNANVLEVGCGTGQLSAYLAASTLSRVYATDMTLASLRLGQDFSVRKGVSGIRFMQMNLFRPAIRPASMDIVISNGVLHHTYDTKKAFMSIARLVKPGGHIVVGLYNRIGRLRTDIRRLLVKAIGERVLLLDPHLRKDQSAERRRAWIRDQYFHPQERKHSMSEVMGWFDEAGFSFVSSIPKIIGTFRDDERLFMPQNRGSAADRAMAEMGMLISNQGGEGGLFVSIGRRKADACAC